jgi:hypothetical protein
MRLSITYHAEYRYEKPVSLSPQVICLFRRDMLHARVESFRFATDHSADVHWRRDLETGEFLIEFPSVIGRTYQIQYSADGIGWKESPVPLTATATRTQWIDRGPPRTDQPPSAVAARWYRLKEAAP